MSRLNTLINKSTYLHTKFDTPKLYHCAYSIVSRDFLVRGGQWHDICPTLCARDYKDPKVVVVPRRKNEDE